MASRARRVAGEAVRAATALLLAIFLSGCGGCDDTHRWVEVRGEGNAFTLLGHCGEDGVWANCTDSEGRDVQTQNLVARRASEICGDRGMRTDRVTKLGEQRIVVVCR